MESEKEREKERESKIVETCERWQQKRIREKECEKRERNEERERGKKG